MPNRDRPLQAGDTGTYGELSAQRKKHGSSEPLDIDHQPSHASNVAAAEQRLGRTLTVQEKTALRNGSGAITSPRAIHQQSSPTYGGRNNPDQIVQDANNPLDAQKRDYEARERAMRESQNE